MTDTRRFDRFLVEGIDGNLIFSTNVDILDISLNGVALKAIRRLEIGREYTVKFEHEGTLVPLKGIVVWSVLSELATGKEDEKVPIYKAGLRFTEVLTDKMSMLQDFIEGSKISENKRLTIRFDVKNKERAILNGPFSYRVKKVGLGGVLIETDLPFDLNEQLPMEIFLSQNRTVRFTGRVTSCLTTSQEVPQHFDVGIEFLEMSAEDRANFEHFLSSL